MSKSVEDYMKELLHCQDLIDLNLTRLARLVTQIQKLRKRENYIWNHIGQMTTTKVENIEKLKGQSRSKR